MGTSALLKLYKDETSPEVGSVLSCPATMVVLADVVLALVKAIVLLWGALTNWAYRLVYRSDKKVNNLNKVGGSNSILIFLGLVGISFGPVATTWKKIHLRSKLDIKDSNEAQMFP